MSADERWKQFKENAVSTGSEDHLKRVYFRRYVNPELALKQTHTTNNGRSEESTTRHSENTTSSLPSTSLSSLWRNVSHYLQLLASADFVHQVRRLLGSVSPSRAGTYILCLFQLLTIWKIMSFLADQSKEKFLAAFQFSLFAHICSLLRTVGVPQMSRQWFQSIVYQEDFAFILFCFVQRSVMPPGTVALIPIACRALVSSCDLLSSLLPSSFPSLYHSLADVFQFILRSRDSIYLLSAITEIILFPITLFRSIQFPQNLFSLFPYSFFLRLRFSFSSHAKLAWRILDSRLEPLVQNYVPVNWRPYYYSLKNFIRGLSRLA